MHEPPRESRLRRAAPALAIFGVAAVLVTAHVTAYDKLSPFDEGVHFDYVVKVVQGDVVTKGEKLGQVAMEEISCHGVDLEGLVLPKCDRDGVYDPSDFPNLGFNSADIHPPVYYGITGLLARGLVALGVAPDMFSAARLAGILWLGLGLLTIWYLGKELDVPTVPLAVVLAAVAATPTLLHASSTVSNDMAGVVAGGALAWATVRWEKGRGSLWVLGLAAVLALALKNTNAVAIGLCALYLVLRRRSPEEGESPPRESNRAGLAVLLGSAGAAMVVWVLIHAATSAPVVTPIDRAFQGTGLELLDVLAHFTSLVTPVSYGLPTTLLGDVAFWSLGGILGVLVLGATIWPVLRGSISTLTERMAVSGGLMMLLGGLPFALASYAFFGEVIVSPRYGISLIPPLAVALAAAITSRAFLWGLGVFAVGQFALVLGTLVAA